MLWFDALWASLGSYAYSSQAKPVAYCAIWSTPHRACVVRTGRITQLRPRARGLPVAVLGWASALARLLAGLRVSLSLSGRPRVCVHARTRVCVCVRAKLTEVPIAAASRASRLPVTGIFIWCKTCGHGGHPDHLAKWFETHAGCPAGARCRSRGAIAIASRLAFAGAFAAADSWLFAAGRTHHRVPRRSRGNDAPPRATRPCRDATDGTRRPPSRVPAAHCTWPASAALGAYRAAVRCVRRVRAHVQPREPAHGPHPRGVGAVHLVHVRLVASVGAGPGRRCARRAGAAPARAARSQHVTYLTYAPHFGRLGSALRRLRLACARRCHILAGTAARSGDRARASAMAEVMRKQPLSAIWLPPAH